MNVVNGTPEAVPAASDVAGQVQAFVPLPPGAGEVTLETILEQFREDARNNRDLGDRFERLMCRFFELDPIYSQRFSKVWMWSEWPGRLNVPDTGIDIVAELRDTEGLCGVQCKFFLPEHQVSKGDIDKFLATLGKKGFTEGIVVSTTDSWGTNAVDALKQSKPVIRLGLKDLSESPIDWSKFDQRRPLALALKPKKKLRPHQEEALTDVVKGLKKADRGKLIMACGTGKTFTALRIAEKIAAGGNVLFLVPSIALLGQSLREWANEAEKPIHSLAVCSDVSVGRRMEKGADDKNEIPVYDLPFPATTSARRIYADYDELKHRAKKNKAAEQMTVVFSTYQSIEQVSKAQKAGLPEFDLIICDEAHRTTGVTLSGEDDSDFVKVHDPKFLKAKKRLYMTATPRVYGEMAKGKAKENDAELCSMDDPEHFGEELHRLGFGKAVERRLLTDYKVLVLAVDEGYVHRTFQQQIIDQNNELQLEDAVKITGCWNGLNKKFENVKGDKPDVGGDYAPMRRAVAFSRSIAESKAFVAKFRQIIDAYKTSHPNEDGLLECQLDHVDGTMNAMVRGKAIDWLKGATPDNTCRILSNARCLSEGVDVPSLDAVLFLNPRNSQVDVVQSVGRVMRLAEGKHYGYIILPIGIPADKTPEEALKDNEKYKVVWQVLQALRAHDDRFNATINKLDINKARPDNIQIIGIGGAAPDEDGKSEGDSKPTVREVQTTLVFPHLDDWKDAIYAKLVLKCGDRRYWETWAKDVAEIAQRHTDRIKHLLKDGKGKHAAAFAEFLKGLQHNLNPSVTKEEAIEMLSQHLITRPVFEALFKNYEFAKNNPVSLAMEKMLTALEDQALSKEVEKLEKFYASVRTRVDGIDNAEGRQSVIKELYDKFFRTAFPRMSERLGIVYTPIEVVDFIIRSVEDVLRDEFGTSIGAEDVHIIDPFTGTGTFIVRLLQSGLINEDDLLRKYAKELHANEIVLLAYYIAAINIEETFHDLHRATVSEEYLPFEGIVLTDTFQLYEPRGEIIEKALPENNKRVIRQKASPITAVIGNPPYSAQQDSANDNNKNLAYPHLDERIRRTYADGSQAPNLKNLYDSYIRAIRWASDRVKDRGVVGIVTNGSFIDANNMDGLRGCIATEFTTVYVFNLRGNARTQGELRRKEAGSVFGGGTRTPVAITLLVKNPDRNGPARLLYHDIGDYLTREQKLKKVSTFGSVGGIAAAGAWAALFPNTSNDWINQRDPSFATFTSLGERETPRESVYFEFYSQGLLTSRDKWCYNFSRPALRAKVGELIETYNADMRKVVKAVEGLDKDEREPVIARVIETDPKLIAWSRGLKTSAARGTKLQLRDNAMVTAMYRPFVKNWLYFDRVLDEFMALTPRVFPEGRLPNLAICVDSRGSTKEFSALMVSVIPDYECISKGQAFPMYWYTAVDEDEELGFDQGEVVDGYRRREAITDVILADFCKAYGPKVAKEDIFYYVYGVLHSPEYRSRFASDLKKMLPRIPLTREGADFWKFSKAGLELAQWHLNYETIEPYPLEERHKELQLDKPKHFEVDKMFHPYSGKKEDLTQIIYNNYVTLAGIPLEAYEYVVNGKPAIEWIIERYRKTVDKDSGIANDPNDWAREHRDPRHILDLVKRVVRVSVETMKIVKSLPALNERV